MHASLSVPLSGAAYRTLAGLVYHHSRIRLGPDKQPLLANRLRSRLRIAGTGFLRCLLSRAGIGSDGDEIDHLVDLISTNHAQFLDFAQLKQRILSRN